MRKIWRNYHIRTIVSIIIGGVVVSSFFYFILSFFKITTIEVEPKTVSVSLDSSQLPVNLIFFPSDHLRTFLLKEYPRIKEVQFIKIFPHTLRIKLTLREPVALLSYKQRKMEIDSEGMTFSYEGNTELPILELPVEQMETGKIAEGQGVQASLAFINKLSHDEAIERIVLSSDRTLEITIKDVKVLITSDADGQKQADTLQTLLKGFRMKGSLPHVIDLRFSKPIITP